MSQPLWTLLIHGPFEPDPAFLRETLGRLRQLRERPNCYIDKVYLSTYQASAEIAESFAAEFDFRVITNADLVNAGFCNINRQINIVSGGLAALDSGNVIKLRIDQTIDFEAFGRVLVDFANSQQYLDGLLTTNCYTRVDRPYHPSDMLMAGRLQNMKAYFAPSIDTRTDLEVRLLVSELSHQPDHFGLSECWPESYLFRRYLRGKNLVLRETWSDSVERLREFCYLVNADSIGFRWLKFEGGRIPLRPYLLLVYPPFRGARAEFARCYYRSSLAGKFDLREFTKRLSDYIFWLKRDRFAIINRLKGERRVFLRNRVPYAYEALLAWRQLKLRLASTLNKS